ncbi:putative cyclin-dependent kinase protein [Daldinia childiae]|uniref:putative cyclin-dependent kinase protein n=1 Tax=Daldinia childiae TaxID=326645 RepID=UPI00144708DE|nr:putative cyclin-dependent kinase protein [Daldinia childiae]KAF3065271.1 putative cyclin-dependent kinase protein [Daldinia childiae]
MKRPLEQEVDTPQEEAERQQYKSLEEYSFLDNSAIDITLETTVIDPYLEVVAPAPPTPPAPARRRSTMTREEARQKAEMLRLRLGLASYKVRTGQTDVSLEQLEAQTLLKSRRPQEPSLPPLSQITHTGEEHDRDGEDHGDKVPSSGRKALPTAWPLSRGSSFDKGPLGTEMGQLPGLTIPWPDSRRASQ